MLPTSDGRKGRPFRNNRNGVERIVYRYRAGVPWHNSPSNSAPGRGSGNTTPARALPRFAIAMDTLSFPTVGRRRWRTRPDAELSGKAYLSNPDRLLLRSRGIEAAIAGPHDQKRNPSPHESWQWR